jgi:hypothetical protein
VDFGLLGPLLVADGARPVVVSAPRQRVLLAILEDLDHPDAGQFRAKLTGLAATART